MARRLPIYFVLDCSESMIGTALTQVEGLVGTVVRALRTDPQALETVHLGVIAYAGVAKVIAPLAPVLTFQVPTLPVGGGTNLGVAIDLLMQELGTSLVRNTPERRGDWKPVIYLFTDGRPTDDPGPAIERWRKNWGTKASIVAVGFGKGADLSTLRRLTESVFLFEQSSDVDFKKFVDWVSNSMLTQSQRVEAGGPTTVASPDEQVVRKAPETTTLSADEQVVSFVGRCSRTKAPYLLKYDLRRGGSERAGHEPGQYELDKGYTLTEDYFAWSGKDALTTQVNTTQLDNFPSCPNCPNPVAFGRCSCGELTCNTPDQPMVCPWCKQSVTFSGSAHFDVKRGRG